MIRHNHGYMKGEPQTQSCFLRVERIKTNKAMPEDLKLFVRKNGFKSFKMMKTLSAFLQA